MNKPLATGVLLTFGLASLTRAAVVVTPFRLEETRTSALVKDTIGRPQDRLKLTLSLTGPEADAAVKYGNLHLDQATDDRGTSLVPGKDSMIHPEKMQEYSNAFFRKFDLEQKKKPADPEMEIDLGLSKRSATKIAHLRDWFEIAQQGTIKTIEVPGIGTPGVKKLDLPAEAGVKVITTVKPGDKNSIGLEITGDESAIESFEVLDGSGKKISNGISSWTFMNGPAHKSLDVQSPLDGTMKLVVKLAMDRKMTKVPFDLKDIVLP